MASEIMAFSLRARSLLIVYQMHLIDYIITLVSVCVCMSVHGSVVERLRPQFFLPIFTKFCMPIGNMVGWTAIVSETNRK